MLMSLAKHFPGFSATSYSLCVILDTQKVVQVANMGKQ